MAIRIIREEGDEILKKKSREVEVIDEKIQTFLERDRDPVHWPVMEQQHKTQRWQHHQIQLPVTDQTVFFQPIKKNIRLQNSIFP